MQPEWAPPDSVEVEAQLLFAVSRMAVAALALLSGDAAEQASGVFVGWQYRVADGGLIGRAITPALAQNPVTDKVLIQADN